MLRKDQTKQVHLPEVYIMPDAAERNVERWIRAARVENARDHIERVRLAFTKPDSWLYRSNCSYFRCYSYPLHMIDSPGIFNADELDRRQTPNPLLYEEELGPRQQIHRHNTPSPQASLGRSRRRHRRRREHRLAPRYTRLGRPAHAQHPLAPRRIRIQGLWLARWCRLCFGVL